MCVTVFTGHHCCNFRPIKWVIHGSLGSSQKPLRLPPCPCTPTQLTVQSDCPVPERICPYLFRLAGALWQQWLVLPARLNHVSLSLSHSLSLPLCLSVSVNPLSTYSSTAVTSKPFFCSNVWKGWPFPLNLPRHNRDGHTEGQRLCTGSK